MNVYTLCKLTILNAVSKRNTEEPMHINNIQADGCCLEIRCLKVLGLRTVAICFFFWNKIDKILLYLVRTYVHACASKKQFVF